MAALPFHSSREHRLGTVTLCENNIINNNTSNAHDLSSYIPYTHLIATLLIKAIIIIIVT